MTRRFRIFDLALDSDVNFPELEVSTESAADFVLKRGDLNEAPPTVTDWFHAFHVEGDDAWLRVGRYAGTLVLMFREFLTVHLDPPHLTIWADPALSEESLRHLLLNQVLPMVVAHASRTVLHAACVTRDGRAVLLAGPAGAGKSTLAAALAMGGWGIAGDDAVAIDVSAVRPGARAAYPGCRVWPDACVGLGLGVEMRPGDPVAKRQFGSAVSAETDALLSSIYLLTAAPPGERPSIEPLSAREAVMGLVRNAYVLDPRDRARAVAHLDQLSLIARRTAISDLNVPRGFEAFDEVRALLERQFSMQPSPCR